MNWRDLIAGAILTLVVSVIAGVIVWYITLDPRSNAEKNLVYSKDNIVTLGNSTPKLGVFVSRYANKGRKIANEVKIGVSFNSSVEIIERQFTTSAGQMDNVKTILSEKQSYSYC